MAKLTVIITENVPVSVRGQLTRWMLEARAGVFVGAISAMVRDKLWEDLCKKTKDGGAILIHSTNNEQKFAMKMHGNCNRSLENYDGLQLVRVPPIVTLPAKPTKPGSKKRGAANTDTPLDSETSVNLVNSELNDLEAKPAKPVRRRASKYVPEAEPEGITLQDGAFPENFIERHAKLAIYKGALKIDYGGRSTYPEFSSQAIWDVKMTSDMENAGKKILDYLNTLQEIEKKTFFNKKIVALDIETTDFLQKAKEGFVNILGLSVLDLHGFVPGKAELFVYQAFNMLRKKWLVPGLLHLGWKHVADADILLVFNRSFDIEILQKIITDYKLSQQIPNNIIDLQLYFNSLEAMETHLAASKNFTRTLSKKGNYSEYYALFKGTKTDGTGKQLEPIGIYNIMDTLSPLYFYILTF